MASDDQNMAKDGALRLYLCDDTEPFRALMRMALPDGAGLEVVGESGDGCSVVDGVVETDADAVLLDLAMPLCDGMTAITVLRRRAPGCAIVVFSGFESGAMAERCRELGADAYVEKGADLDEVRTVLRRAVGRRQRLCSRDAGACSRHMA